MKEVAMLKTESEFEDWLKEFEEGVDLESLSLISRREQVVDSVLKLNEAEVFSVGQIRQIFDLAK